MIMTREELEKQELLRMLEDNIENSNELKIDEEDEIYSDIEHKCGIYTFKVLEKHIDVYNKIKDKKGFIIKLNSCSGQITFNMVLQDKLDVMKDDFGFHNKFKID